MAHSHDPVRHVYIFSRSEPYKGKAANSQTCESNSDKKHQSGNPELKTNKNKSDGFTPHENPSPTDPTNNHAPDQQIPINWMDHPITRTLDGLYQNSAITDPVQIIADSVAPRPHHPEAPKTSTTTADAASPLDLLDPGPYAQFWQVWTLHQDFLLKQCLKLMSGNKADAEDALSNAMLRAAQKYMCYCDTIVNERAWLNRLVQNVCIDHFRRQRRETHWEGDDDALPKATSPLFQKTPQTPEEITLTQEQLQKLQDHVGQLSAKLRAPLLMRFVGGMSYNEIAECLEVKSDTVRKRIQLAREHLRKAGFW